MACEIDLLRAGQRQQQVERPFPAVEAEIELVAVAHRRDFEGVGLHRRED